MKKWKNRYRGGDRVGASVAGSRTHVAGTVVSVNPSGSYGIRLEAKDPHGRTRIVERPVYAVSAGRDAWEAIEAERSN